MVTLAEGAESKLDPEWVALDILDYLEAGGRVSADAAHGVVIVGIGDFDVIPVFAVVVFVVAGRWLYLDRVGLIVVVEHVVLASDGDGLGCVPVVRCEEEGGLVERALVLVTAVERDGDVGGRLGVEDDGELGLAASFGGDQVLNRIDGDAGRFVVGVGEFDVGAVFALVASSSLVAGSTSMV